MNNRKYYNFETSFSNLREQLRAFLRENGIKYELSDCSLPGCPCWHFEILCNSDEVKLCNDFLDSITINEEK